MSPHLAQLRLDLRMIGGSLQRFFGKRIPLIVLSSTGRVLMVGCEFLVISTVPSGFRIADGLLLSSRNPGLTAGKCTGGTPTEIIMVVAILAMIARYASFALAKFPAMVAGVALQIMNGSVRWLGGLRIADTRVPTPQLALILLGACALVLAIVLSRRRWLLVAGGCWVDGLGVQRLLDLRCSARSTASARNT
jgi:hypothetical protein